MNSLNGDSGFHYTGSNYTVYTRPVHKEAHTDQVAVFKTIDMFKFNMETPVDLK